jgi:CHASE2 domain-containing sensor protein
MIRLIVRIVLAAAVSIGVVVALTSGLAGLLGKIASPDGATVISVLLRNHHSTAIPVTIVDIDSKTYQAWGSPPITPRDKLFALIDRISRLGPLAIVVDIDLAATPARDVVSLATFVDRRGAADPSPQPPLLLVRRLAPDPKGNEAAAQLPAIHPGLDTAVRDTATVKWVSALMTPEDDATVRKWRAFHALCGETPPRAVPAIALAVEVLRRGGIKDYPALEQRLSDEAAKVCGGKATARSNAAYAPQVPDYPVPVPYMFGWSVDSDPYFQTTDTANGRRPLLVRMSAHDIERVAMLSSDPFERRVVLIGASHPDSQDFRRTPLGTMPGVYVLANTVAGARDMLDAPFSPRTTTLLFAVPLFAICAFIGVMTRSVAGIPIVAAVVALAAVTGLLLELPPFAIHEGAISAAGALVVVLAMQQTWQLVTKLAAAKSGKSTWRDLVLSDTGKWLYGRFFGEKPQGGSRCE